MDDSDKREFAQTLQGLGEVRGKPLSKAALSVYWLALSDWDIEEFRAIAKHLLKHSQFMPTPYDFEQARKVDDTADEAWLQVLEAIRTRHHTSATSISPKIDHVVRMMGGYAVLSMVNTDDLVWRQKRFAELWETASDVDDRRAALEHYQPTLTITRNRPNKADFSNLLRRDQTEDKETIKQPQMRLENRGSNEDF